MIMIVLYEFFQKEADNSRVRLVVLDLDLMRSITTCNRNARFFNQ